MSWTLAGISSAVDVQVKALRWVFQGDVVMDLFDPDFDAGEGSAVAVEQEEPATYVGSSQRSAAAGSALERDDVPRASGAGGPHSDRTVAMTSKDVHVADGQNKSGVTIPCTR